MQALVCDQDPFLACDDQGASGGVTVLFEFPSDGKPGAGRG